MTLSWFCCRVGTTAGAFCAGCSERPGKLGVLFRMPAGMVKLMLLFPSNSSAAHHGASHTGETEAEEQILWSPRRANCVLLIYFNVLVFVPH